MYSAPPLLDATLPQSVEPTNFEELPYTSAIAPPSFDSATTVDSNFAAASVATLDSIETVAVLDAKTGEAIDESFFFGGLPVGGKVQTRSFTLTNTGASDLRFSDFAELGDAESTVLSYTLYNQNGDALEPNVSFVMGAGETFTLEIRITPKSVGSKFFELSWTTTNLNSSGTPVSGTKKSFKFQGSAEIAKVASSTVSVATIDDLGDNISVSTAGSLSINLSKIPSSDAILYLGTSSDVVELSSDVLLFTTSNYISPQTIAVSLDSSKLAESGFPDEIVIYPRLLAADPNYSGAVFAEITFKVADYVVFQDDCYVNLFEGGERFPYWFHYVEESSQQIFRSFVMADFHLCVADDGWQEYGLAGSHQFVDDLVGIHLVGKRIIHQDGFC